MQKRKGFIFALSLAFGLVSNTAMATAQTIEAEPSLDNAHLELPEAGREYPISVKDVELEDVLRIFATNLEVGIKIDEEFDGERPVEFMSESSRSDFLSELSFQFDFSWYFDGTNLHIWDVGKVETKVFSLQESSGAQMLELLRSLGVYQNRFFHRSAGHKKALLVSGPKSYLDLVEQVVEATETADARQIVILRGSTRAATRTAANRSASAGSGGSSGGTPSGGGQ